MQNINENADGFINKVEPHSSLILISLQWNHNCMKHFWCTTGTQKQFVLRNHSAIVLHLTKQMTFVALKTQTCNNQTAKLSGCWDSNGSFLKTATKLTTIRGCRNQQKTLWRCRKNFHYIASVWVAYHFIILSLSSCFPFRVAEGFLKLWYV